MEETRKSPEEILCLSFNQDASCLAVGRPRGFDIFSIESTALLHREDCGVVRLVEMLFRTSLVALVGDTLNRQLTMWNTKARAGICSLQFPSEISSVKMNHRRAVVLLRQKVHIFDLKTMKALHVIDRSDQAPGMDPGLCSLCCDPERGLLAAVLVAGSQGASVDARAGLVGVVDTYTLQPLGAVLAHRTPVRAMRLNSTGQLLATASARGTVVRLWAVPSFTMLCSFRRGANECCIHGLAFAADSKHLMAAAANGTVHIFRSPKEAVDCVAPCQTQERPVEAERLQAVGSRDALEALEEEDDDLSEWNIVDCDRSRARTLERKGLQGHVHKVKSILTQLWQPCRDYLDGPGAIAWVHQGKEESNIAPSSPRSPALGPLLPLPPAMLELFTPAFLACLLPHRDGEGNCLVVASRTRGVLSTFDWTKGEGLLASRQALSAPAQPASEDVRCGTALLQTPPMQPISPSPMIEASPASPMVAVECKGISECRAMPPFELEDAMDDGGHVEMELVVQDADPVASNNDVSNVSNVSISKGGGVDAVTNPPEDLQDEATPTGDEPHAPEVGSEASEAYEEDFEKSSEASEEEAEEEEKSPEEEEDVADSIELEDESQHTQLLVGGEQPPRVRLGSPELLPAAWPNEGCEDEASEREEDDQDDQDDQAVEKAGEDDEAEEAEEEVEEIEEVEGEEGEEEECTEDPILQASDLDQVSEVPLQAASTTSRRERRAQRREERRTQAVLLKESAQDSDDDVPFRRRRKGRRRSEDSGEISEVSRVVQEEAFRAKGKKSKPVRSNRQDEVERVKDVVSKKGSRRTKNARRGGDEEPSDNEVPPEPDESGRKRRTGPRTR